MLVAFPSSLNPLRFKAIELVTLAEAAVRKNEGWWVLGPDPQDEIEWAAWVRSCNQGSFLPYDPEDPSHD